MKKFNSSEDLKKVLCDVELTLKDVHGLKNVRVYSALYAFVNAALSNVTLAINHADEFDDDYFRFLKYE